METDTAIYFYNLKNEYDYMSNFYKTSFIDKNNIQYNCSEQYFMYMKCILFDSDNTTLLTNILNETSPSRIKKYGRQVKNYDETVWTSCRELVMYDALQLKFTQNLDIQQKLINTNDKTLYEASKYDKIWGIGYYAPDAIALMNSKKEHQFGTNLLGQLLMKLRNEFKQQNEKE